MKLTRFSALFLLLLAACDEDPATMEIPPRLQPQSTAEIAFVRATLDRHQAISIRENREFCGYIGVDPSGQFIATAPKRGREGSCRARWPGDDFGLLASFHTHGAFSEEYDSEVPSYDDMVADITEAIDGYIATPGGRVWYIDAENKLARLVCGPGCLTSDPNYSEDFVLPVRTTYTLDGIYAREGN